MEHLTLIEPQKSRKNIFERWAFDQPYLDRLSEGDPYTWSHFTSYFNKLLLVKLRSSMLARELMEDAKQETFLRILYVMQKKGGIQKPERLGSFVNSVCDNVLLEFFRAGARYRQWPEIVLEPPSLARSAESELISEEHKALIRARLRELPETDREMLRKVFLEERNKDEICMELNITRNTLRVRIHRALRRFRLATKTDAAGAIEPVTPPRRTENAHNTLALQ